MVIVADDEPVALVGLQSALTPVYGKVKLLEDSRQVLPGDRALKPDVLLLGYFRWRHGRECWRLLSMLRVMIPELPIIVRAPVDDPHLAWLAHRMGAAGLIPNDAPVLRVIGAVSEARRGHFGRPPRLEGENLLTPRQLRVLQEAATGRPHKEIAGRLGLTVSAIDHHLARARKRLGASSRDHLFVIAAERLLLGIDPARFTSRGGGAQ
ncbi:MAG: hypothetical protein KJZ47_10490 [Gemmatimonadales bacterium]|nr:hypothetical protein [Gemmatimonadales bacterium]